MSVDWLENLQRELDGVDIESIRPPGLQQQEHEHFVGLVAEPTRRVYVLAHLYARTAAELDVQARFGGDEALIEQYLERIVILQSKSNLLMEIFWATLRDAFGLWTKSDIGVRKDWRVVWIEPPQPDLGEVLGEFLDP